MFSSSSRGSSISKAEVGLDCCVFSFNSMAAGLASGLSVSTSEPMVVCSKTMRTSIVLTRWIKNGVQKQGDQDFICHYELRDLQCRDALIADRRV